VQYVSKRPPNIARRRTGSLIGSSDYGDVGDYGDLDLPTPLFCISVENKGPSTNLPMRDPCVTLGCPLGGPSVAQGPPNPRPNPKIGRGSQLVKAARRKFAAPQTVIVSDRRSREPNDLKSDSELG
jgi:hypothetical protein